MGHRRHQEDKQRRRERRDRRRRRVWLAHCFCRAADAAASVFPFRRLRSLCHFFRPTARQRLALARASHGRQIHLFRARLRSRYCAVRRLLSASSACQKTAAVGRLESLSDVQVFREREVGGGSTLILMTKVCSVLFASAASSSLSPSASSSSRRVFQIAQVKYATTNAMLAGKRSGGGSSLNGGCDSINAASSHRKNTTPRKQLRRNRITSMAAV